MFCTEQLSRLARIVTAAAVTLLSLAGAVAQAASSDYPVRPVRFVVPFPPGGAVDIVARLLAQQLTEALGQQVVIDNRGGASTIIGTELVARATPDGYTLLMGTTALATNPGLYPKLPYDAARDLAPIVHVGSTPLVLVVPPTLAVHTVKDLIALAQAKRGQLNFASSGNAGPAHLAGELFKTIAGVDMVHVPFRGAGLALPALAGSQVQLMFATMPSAMPLVKSGQIRAIAVTSLTRVRAAPELPPVAETLPKFEVAGWYGLLAPAKTPAAIIQRLNKHTASILQRPDFRDRVAADGTEAKGGTPAEFAAYIASETQKWANVIRRAGVKAE